MKKGRWAALDGQQGFLPDVPARKPLGANFYPENMNREEFEAWVQTLSKDQKEQAEGFFTVIRREGGKLHAVPFSKEYAADLQRLAKLLHEAAALTANPTL